MKLEKKAKILDNLKDEINGLKKMLDTNTQFLENSEIEKFNLKNKLNEIT